MLGKPSLAGLGIGDGPVAFVTILATAPVGTYLALGLVILPSIPLAYEVMSVISLAAFFRTEAFRAVRLGQLGMTLALPFALQWSLGGYEASTAVSLWALIAAFAALFFYRAEAAGLNSCRRAPPRSGSPRLSRDCGAGGAE